METKTGYADIDKGRLYYEVTGRGPAVVLGHAGIADLRMWDTQVEPLSERFTVVRYDVRGFGRSSAPKGDFHPEQDLRGLLDHLEIARAAMVGVSMSGGIAVDFAVSYPERLWALVPVAAGLEGFDWSTDEALKEYAAAETAAMESGDIEEAIELNLRFWVDGPHRSPNERLLM